MCTPFCVPEKILSINVQQGDHSSMLQDGDDQYSSRWGCTCAGDNWQYMGLYAKFGQPAGSRFNQYDFRPEWDYYKADDNDMEIAFDASKQGFQTGAD